MFSFIVNAFSKNTNKYTPVLYVWFNLSFKWFMWILSCFYMVCMWVVCFYWLFLYFVHLRWSCIDDRVHVALYSSFVALPSSSTNLIKNYTEVYVWNEKKKSSFYYVLHSSIVLMPVSPEKVENAKKVIKSHISKKDI